MNKTLVLTRRYILKKREILDVTVVRYLKKMKIFNIVMK